MSPEAARQRVSRVRPPIYRFPISLLPKNESFLYRDVDRNSERFWTSLIHELRETNSIFGLAIDGLIARGGAAPLPSFIVASGAPLAQKGQVPAAGVVQRLQDAGLLERMELGDFGECVFLNSSVSPTPTTSELRARCLAENVLLEGVREWARKLGLASYNSIDVREQAHLPKFGPYNFDLCGPSYLMPLVTHSGATRKPGFLVADVFVGSTLELSQVQYFLRKVRMLKAMRRVVPFLPMIVADGYSREALRAGRAIGVVMATTRNLFGEAVAASMTSLLDTITRAAAIAASNPERVVSLLDSLSAIEGAAGNLRGALFEMIVGFLVREVEGNTIDIGEIVFDPESGKSAEIDVRRIKEKQECWFYECRGRQPSNLISVADIEDWLSKVDRIYRYHRSQTRFQNCHLGFEMWTSGGFHHDAIDKLVAEKKRRTKIMLRWRDGPGVREYAQTAGRKSIIKTLDEHYFKHPLSI